MPTIRRFATNLRCASCIARVTPFLDRVPGIEAWEVDTSAAEKTLTVTGDAAAGQIRDAFRRAGFELLGDLPVSVPLGPVTSRVRSASADTDGHLAEPAAEPITPGTSPTTYLPILMLGAYLVGTVALVEVRSGGFEWDRAMGTFMGAFFIAFSFFKMLNLRGFADAYRTYDVVARRVPIYGYVYPFLELGLGVAYVLGTLPTVTNTITLVVMSVSSVGVIHTLMKGRWIRCACLGTVFNLPMSSVTLIEDGLMVAMAAVALVNSGH